jgi:hypothetical protein
MSDHTYTTQTVLKASEVCKRTGVKPGLLVEATLKDRVRCFVNNGQRFYLKDDLTQIEEAVTTMERGWR